MSVTMTDAARDYIVTNGYDPIYGARPLRRYIQSQVENRVARTIIEGKIHEGTVFTIDADENGLIVRT